MELSYEDVIDGPYVECAMPGCGEQLLGDNASWNNAYGLPYCNDEERDIDADRVQQANWFLKPFIIHNDDVEPYGEDVGTEGHKPWIS